MIQVYKIMTGKDQKNREQFFNWQTATLDYEARA